MASGPRRRWSKGLPPNLSELMNKLVQHAASFIQQFDNSEPEMRRIVGEFQRIVDEVKMMQKSTDTARTTGAAIVGVMILAAPFTVGLSLLVAAAAGVVVVDANVTKTRKENKSAEEVEKLGEEFMEIVKPLENDLEEIKEMCAQMEQKAAQLQAENTLSDVEEFQRILGRVSELKGRSEELLFGVITVRKWINELLLFFINIFRVTATPEEDEKLRETILQSADQYQRIIYNLIAMKKELKDFGAM